MRPPCKDCPDRAADPNCHANCKRYSEYRAWRDEQNAIRAAESSTVWASEAKLKSARKALNRYKRDH